MPKKKVPQFFERGKLPEASDRAVYTIPGRDKHEKDALVLVECLEGHGNVPRNATAFSDLQLKLGAEFEAVARLAESALEKLKKIAPGEVEIEFGVELGGSAGIPMITKTEGKANFKVTLKWSKEATEK